MHAISKREYYNKNITSHKPKVQLILLHLRSKDQNSTLPVKSFKEIIQSGISWSIKRISYPHHKATNLIHYIDRVVIELQGNRHILARVE